MKKEIRIVLALPVFALLMQATSVYALPPEVLNIGTSSAQIKWQSDFTSSYAYVTYGTTSGLAQYPNTTRQSCQVSESTSIANNTSCMQLSNLVPGTTYYFKSISIPQTDSTQLSVMNNQIITSSEGHFTTSALPTMTTPTAPVTPLSFTAALSTTGGTLAINLSWRNTSTSDARFKITKSLVGTQDTTIPLTGVGLTNYSDAQVSQGQTYTYTIATCSVEGLCSAPSTSVTVRVPQATPTAVPNLVVRSLEQNPYSINLSWVNQASGNTKIELTRALSSGTISPTILSSQLVGSSTSYTDTVTAPGSYTYAIKVCSETGVCSAATNATINVTSPTVTQVNTPLSVTNTQPSTSTTTKVIIPLATTSPIVPVVQLCWDCNTTTPTTTVVTPAPIAKVIETVPSLPTTFYASQIITNGVQQKSIRLTWTDTSSNETRFKMYRSSTSGGSELITIDANKTSYDDVNLTPGVYTYYISACNLLGCSAGNARTNEVTILENKIDIQPVQDFTLLEISNALGKLAPGTFINILPVTTTAIQSHTATVLSDGTFKIKIPDGQYIVEGIIPIKTITILNGKVTAIATKTNTSSKNIVGKVMLSDGTSIANAEVVAYKKETSESISSLSDSKGNYSLTVSAGIWNVLVRVKNGQEQEWTAPKTESTANFSSEDITESSTINFTVTPLNSSLALVVKDENGTVLPSIGVVIDTLTLAESQKAQNTSRKIITEKTDAAGTVTVRVPAGNYYIRTIVPESQNYTESEETQVSLANGSTKATTITLKKKVVSNTVVFSGITKFEDGRAVDAYVSLWSNEGNSVNTKTTTSGAFSVQVEKDQNWHIRAIKDADGKSFSSDEQTLSSAFANKNIELTFVRSESVALAAQVVIQKAAQEQVIASIDNGARFTLPPNTVNSSGNISVTIKPTTEASSQAAQTLVSTAYDITVKNNEGVQVTKLANDAEILIPYDENELKAKGVTLESVIPSYYDETLGTWVSVPNFTINTVKKVFVLHVNHLTRFALIAAADTIAPTSPTNIVTDAITPTDVRITWNNPSNDFNHSKIYRSENPGTFGQVIAAEVFSNSFIDKTGALGKKIYYYTIRAVDAAGNESGNTNQIAVTTFNDSLATNKSPSLLLPPGQVSSGEITRTLSLGAEGDDVLSLQKALKYDGFYATGPLTGYYGKRTENAVFRFQNYYKNELLIPNGYKIGTGVLGSITRKKINEIIVASGQ